MKMLGPNLLISRNNLIFLFKASSKWLLQRYKSSFCPLSFVRWFATTTDQKKKKKTEKRKGWWCRQNGRWLQALEGVTTLLTCSVIGVYWATALFRSGKICEAGKSRNSVADALNFQLNVTLCGLASNSHKTLIVSWRPPLYVVFWPGRQTGATIYYTCEWTHEFIPFKVDDVKDG